MFMNQNDLDLQMGGMKLFMCLPVVLKHHAVYVLLNIIRNTEQLLHILEKGYASLWKVMKGQNQPRNENDVTYTLYILYT